MPKFTKAKNNFTSGELDPRLNARDDIAQYENGLETCTNFQVMPFGGIKKRNGTKYVAEVKDSTKKVRLVNFEFSVEQAYVIEFGDQYVRFYRNQGQILSGGSPYEVATPYLEADLPALKFTQSADVLFIAHPDYKPRELSRTGHTSWTLSEFDYINGPFLDDNLNSTTIESTGVVGNVTLTASSAIFDADHVGSLWKLTRGKLGSIVDGSLSALNATTSSISLAGSVVVFKSLGTWSGQLTIERSFDNGSSWFGYEVYTENTTKEFVDSRDVLFRVKMTAYTSGSATIRLSQLSTDSESFGTVKITGYTSSTVVSATVVEELSEETIGSSSQLVSNGTFVSDISDWDDLSTGTGSIAWNAGEYMDMAAGTSGTATTEQEISIASPAINHNLSFDTADGDIDLRIGTTTGAGDILAATTYTPGSHSYVFTPGVSTIFLQFEHSDDATYTLDNVSLDSALAGSEATTYWAEGAWSDYRGWPRAIGFYEQRLFFASTNNQPSTLWGSRTADFVNFKAGVDDDNALVYNLAADGVNIARWLVPWNVLSLGTAGAEWKISGSSLDEALTPSNVLAKSETHKGSADLQAVQAAKSVIFVDRTARNIRQLTYSYNENAYDAVLLNQISKHIIGSDIVDITYQEEPDSIFWFVLEDGGMVGLTYNPEHKIIAFFSFETSGDIESAATIPATTGGRDELWLAIKRNINGSDVRYVEFLNEVVGDIEDEFYVDCGLSYSGSAVTTLSGLDHLEGEEVNVFGNGSIYADNTVSGGQITVSPAVTDCHVGLNYTATARVLPFTQGAADGSGQGRLKRVFNLVFNLYESVGMKFGIDADNLDEIFFSTTSPPSLFTGLKTAEITTDPDAEQQITVVSDTPTPCTILAIIARGDTSQL